MTETKQNTFTKTFGKKELTATFDDNGKLQSLDRDIPSIYILKFTTKVKRALDDDDLPLPRFIPVQGKRPFHSNWQNRQFADSDYKGATGIGFFLGENYLAIDCDDDVALDWVSNNLDSFDQDTVTVSSGKVTQAGNTRKTLLFYFTADQKQTLQDKGLTPKTTNFSNLPHLEFLSGNKQFVIDGFHPTTGSYDLINPFTEYSVKACPDDLFNTYLEALDKNKSSSKQDGKGKKKSNSGQSNLIQKFRPLFDKLGVGETYDYISGYFDCAEYGEWQQWGQGKLAGIDPVNGKGETGTAFQINIDPDNDKYGTWYNHATGEGGSLIKFIMQVGDCEYKQAVKHLETILKDHGIEVSSGGGSGGYYDQSNYDLITYACIEWLIDSEYITSNNEFYQYTGLGYWKHKDQATVRTEISHFLFHCYINVPIYGEDGVTIEDWETKYNYFSKSNITKCLETAIDYLNFKDSLPNNNHLICFLNGTYDIKLDELQQHRKDDYLFCQVPFNFNPEDDHPEQFLAFLTSAIGDEQIKYIQAWIQTLLDRTAPYGKFLHLIGESGCGKGTLLNLMASLLAPENVCGDVGVSLLNNPDKRHQYLNNTRFFYATDVAGYFTGVQAFYSLVENEKLSGRKLHSSDTYTQKWDCLFALASVDYLQIENSGAGWSRRVIPIEFVSRQGKKDLYLDSKLAEEIPQIIAWAFKLSPEERDEILHGELSSTQQESIKEQEAQSDPINAFINDCLKPDYEAMGDNDPITSNDEMWENYQAYCKEVGKQAGSYKRFINKLKRELGNHIRKRNQYQNRKQAFKGLYFAPAFTKRGQEYDTECDLSQCFQTNFDEPEPTLEDLEQESPESSYEQFKAKFDACRTKKQWEEVDDELSDLYEKGKIPDNQLTKLQKISNDAFSRIRDKIYKR